MFTERLVCPSQVELAGTEHLIVTNFPTAAFTPVFDPDDFVCDLILSVDRPVFFRWAVTSISESGLLVVSYCLYMLTDLILEPPTWMRGVLSDLKIPYRIASEDSIE